MKSMFKYNVRNVICFNQGEQYKFGLYLDQKYGEGTSDELHQRAMTIVKLSRTDYEEAIKNIEKKLKDI